MYTLPYVKQIANGKLLYSTELSSVPCDDLEVGGGGLRGREYMYTYIDSYCSTAEANTTL